MHHPTDRIIHTTAFVTPVEEHWLYGIRHMVKDHSDSERGNPLPPHRLFFPISSKGSFICYTSRGALAGMNPCRIWRLDAILKGRKEMFRFNNAPNTFFIIMWSSDQSLTRDGHNELFLVPASAPQLV